MARHYYSDEYEGSTITRHARAGGIPYTIQNEQRYVPSNVDQPRKGSGGYQATPDQEEDVNKQNQRRRINIACGRCRKRKIRCSGEQGGGGCQNCKTAGVDNCQFNRVQAQDMLFAEHLSPYSLGTLPAHVPMRTMHTQYCEAPASFPMVPLSSQVRMPFRQTAVDYPRVYAGPYGDYADELAYNNMYPPPPMHHELSDVGYGSGNIPPLQRSFTPAPPLAHKSSNVSFYDASSSYPQQPQGQHLSSYTGHGQHFTIPMRSSTDSGDTHNVYSFPDLPQRLPNPSGRALPVPTSRLATRYDTQMTYNGNIVPSHALTVLTPVQPQIKSLGTTRLLTNDGAYASMSTSPDGTMTTNSNFGSTDTGTSSQSELYGGASEWSNDGIQHTSPTHSAIPQQQQHQLSSQTQMLSTSLSSRRSHNDLQNEMDNYNHNSVAHNSNANHPYNLSNGSVGSLHAHSSVNLNSNSLDDIQESASGEVTQVPQHPQVRKLSHHHSTHFSPVPSSSDTSLGSSLQTSSAGNSTLSSFGTTAYSNGRLCANDHISGEANTRTLASMLSDGQAYTTWDGSPPRNSHAQTMAMDRILA